MRYTAATEPKHSVLRLKISGEAIIRAPAEAPNAIASRGAWCLANQQPYRASNTEFSNPSNQFCTMWACHGREWDSFQWWKSSSKPKTILPRFADHLTYLPNAPIEAESPGSQARAATPWSPELCPTRNAPHQGRLLCWSIFGSAGKLGVRKPPRPSTPSQGTVLAAALALPLHPRTAREQALLPQALSSWSVPTARPH